MASKRRLRRNTCGNKIGHATKIKAVDHAIYLKMKSTMGDFLKAYKCKYCGKSHVGH